MVCEMDQLNFNKPGLKKENAELRKIIDEK